MKNDQEQRAFAVDSHYQRGLTKRELFAAMALQGYLSDTNVIDAKAAAEVAVIAADCLIKQLNKSKNKTNE